MQCLEMHLTCFLFLLIYLLLCCCVVHIHVFTHTHTQTHTRNQKLFKLEGILNWRHCTGSHFELETLHWTWRKVTCGKEGRRGRKGDPVCPRARAGMISLHNLGWYSLILFLGGGRVECRWERIPHHCGKWHLGGRFYNYLTRRYLQI